MLILTSFYYKAKDTAKSLYVLKNITIKIDSLYNKSETIIKFHLLSDT